TKLHEQVLRGPLGEVRERLAAQGPRGELTLVVAGAAAGGGAQGRVADPAGLAAEVAARVEGGTSTRDAVTAVAEATGIPRRVVYQAVLDARGGRG
ncbi:MAG TPA: 16S rRNA (cytidine(1402)-2'-O)-methyltransferase, partial [Actinomycetes bacterium]|nr:16S rRNA (cytidine(1402)-2'-O)-methyltransferase [Actinomycetes bacterium]